MNKRNYFTATFMSAMLTVTALFGGCGAEEESSSVVEPTASSMTIVATTEPVTDEQSDESTEADTTAEDTTAAESPTEDITEALTEENTEADFVENAYVEYHFRNQKLLNQHFEKHGGEFDGDFNYATAADYEKGASDVINSDEALYKTEAEDGDGVYYIEVTNEFVILSTDGFIRTYFRPTAGIDYFNRQ